MVTNSYQQYCALARALDVAGDRWTLLIVRELLLGPRRFTDLLAGLPGASRSLVTQRLRALEREGVIAREDLPPPAARQVYALTEEGLDLASAMAPLAAWGARRLGVREPGESFRARWPAAALALFADRDAARGVSETYQYVVGDSAFHFTVDDGSVAAHDGIADHPAVVVTTDEETWAQLAGGEISARSAAASGHLKVTGDPEAVIRLARIFSRHTVFAQAEATISGAGRRG
jgi:DNA-binding HxlR family transcriptional regulator/putative sterol carrier protein